MTGLELSGRVLPALPDGDADRHEREAAFIAELNTRLRSS